MKAQPFPADSHRSESSSWVPRFSLQFNRKKKQTNKARWRHGARNREMWERGGGGGWGSSGISLGFSSIGSAVTEALVKSGPRGAPAQLWPPEGSSLLAGLSTLKHEGLVSQNHHRALNANLHCPNHFDPSKLTSEIPHL